MATTPVPSRSSSTSTDDSLVVRSIRAVLPTVDLLTGAQERVVVGRGADGGPQVAGNVQITDEHAAVQVLLPGRTRVGEDAEQHEVRVGLDDGVPEELQRGDHPVPFGDQELDRRQ